MLRGLPQSLFRRVAVVAVTHYEKAGSDCTMVAALVCYAL